MNNLLAAIDAFANPDSVWYYVVGIVFLVLIFAALAIYVVLSNKKKKAQGDGNGEAVEGNAEENKVPENTDEPAPAEEVKADDGSQAEEKTEEDTAPEPQAQEEPALENNDEAAEEQSAAPIAEEPKEEEPTNKKAKDKSKDAQPVIKIVEKKPAAKKSDSSDKKAEPAAKAEPKKSAPKKSAAAKPFIDRLLAAKSAHGVYNEIKNTVLSYPGIKAKLTKDDEQFIYVDKKMAAVALDGESVTLYLALDKAAVPSGFDVQAADGDFGVKTTVAETDIDSARRLIVFAMNVSMLTRNDKKRYVDYIQKAKDAKQRAKKK